MDGASLNKLPGLGLLILALLTHNMMVMSQKCLSDIVNTLRRDVEVCRVDGSAYAWVPLTCGDNNTDINTALSDCLDTGCTCPMTMTPSQSIATTITETVQTTVMATVFATVVSITMAPTTVVSTETVLVTASCPVMSTPNTNGVDANINNTKCTALGGGLGILTGALAIILVGVVIGWVWSWHRKRGKSHLEERDHTPKTPSLQNPTYSPTSFQMLHPSIQYSSTGPHDTPPSNTIPTTYDVVGGVASPGGEQEQIYHMLEETGDGDYYVLGDERAGHDYQVLEAEGEGHDYEDDTALTYEVPVPSQATPTPIHHHK